MCVGAEQSAHRWVVGSDNGTQEIAEYPATNVDDGSPQPSKVALHVTQTCRMQDQGGQNVEEPGGQGTHTFTSSPTPPSMPHPAPPSPRVHEEREPEPVDLVWVVGVGKRQEATHIGKAVHLQQ